MTGKNLTKKLKINGLTLGHTFPVNKATKYHVMKTRPYDHKSRLNPDNSHIETGEIILCQKKDYIDQKRTE